MLYNECEKEIKILQEDNEMLKIRVKDLGEYVQLKDKDKNETSENDSDDVDADNWKTVLIRRKEKQVRKDPEDVITCSICSQYVLTMSELKAHILRCHVKEQQ